MKSDLYTKIVLTAIAALLAGILVSQRLGAGSPRDVRIVGIVTPSPEQRAAAIEQTHKNIWSPLPVEGDVDVSGSVDVDNTVDVSVVP